MNINIREDISRTPTLKVTRKTPDEYGRIKQSGIHVTGRIVMNVWRIIRHEVKLSIYTFQNVVFNILGKRLLPKMEIINNFRIPEFSYKSMTKWFEANTRSRALIFQYHIDRTELNLRILDRLDFISRTRFTISNHSYCFSELSRVYGIDFFSVISRGSQYKVESMMLRLTKPRNFIALSPSREQVRNQNAIECLPLVMEPESKLYTSPVLVLDFQSLYPSIIIAYNLW